ncbi:ATP-dependent RNA helicase [Podospora conica]|nr:ATP-dependent RNA helicase [Schizothecium conicum]
MYIFKVLSRGTKPKKPANATTGPSTSKAPLLPSAGARVNPQFFHDDVSGLAAARGKKRKRRKNAAAGADDDNDETAPADDDDDASDIDFFAPPKPATAAATTTPAQDEAEDKEQQAKKINERLLDEDECRMIFKSHRLKFTVLAGGTVAPEEEEEPVRKKSKKQKGDGKKDVEEDKKKKDDKLKQLFPQPLNKFGELRHIYGIAPTLADNIARQGFRVPTEVQMGALPLLLRPSLALKKVKGDVVKVDEEQGVDFLGVAPTGSGKTISFLIPAIDRILRRRGENTEEHVLEAVVVAPTRELASQIVNEGRKLALGTGVRVVLMKRGVTLAADDLEQVKEPEEKNDQEKAEAEESEEEDQNTDSDSDADDKTKARAPRGPTHVDILVTTPKTLLNFLSGEKVPSKNPKARKALPTVRSLILDEADVLLDPLFRKQTTAIWNACTHPSLTLTCWSATMASSIEALITKQLSKRAARLSLPTPPPVLRLVVGLKDTAVPNVTHKLIYAATEQGKLLGLRNLLHPSGGSSDIPLRPPFLVFTQTIERAQALFSELQYDIPPSAGGGAARLAVLHSSLPDAARARIMARFRAGDVWVLITTDVLARGIDFAGVNGVVNYDVPGSAAAYVHRAGRTGRAGREGGVAVTFYTKEDIPFVRSVANVIAASERQAGGGGGGEGSTVQKWLLDALPRVAKGEKRKLSVRGVEARRAGGKATIGTKGGWEKQKENNKKAAIEASKRRKREGEKGGGGGGGREEGSDGSEWGGLE